MSQVVGIWLEGHYRYIDGVERESMVFVVERAELFVQRARVDECDNDDEGDEKKPDNVDHERSGC